MTKFIIVAKIDGCKFAIGNGKKLADSCKSLGDFDPIELTSDFNESQFYFFPKFLTDLYVDALNAVSGITDVCVKEVKFDIDF